MVWEMKRRATAADRAARQQVCAIRVGEKSEEEVVQKRHVIN
jgi:hypothetical protein